MSKNKTISFDKLHNLFALALPEKERERFILQLTNYRTHELSALTAAEQATLYERLGKVVKMALPAQIQKLQCLYRELDILDYKKEILLHFTEGRTDSTALLTFEEARELIQDIAQHEPSEKLRKSIFSFAYLAGIIYGETETDKKINRAKLNMFLRERGTVKKDIEKQTLPELKRTQAQFAAMIGHNGRAADNKQAKQVTDALLQELNITTT